jgi:mRNA interferase YafQ
MRMIERTTQFKKDYKREFKGQYSKKITTILPAIVHLLISDEKLPIKYKDHQLQGEYLDCRDCHITPDLVLIYKKVNKDVLQLVRIGSHSELFG